MSRSGTDIPTCPRCGYDLRGVVATWVDRCPVGGECTECGLAFEWMHVLAHSVHPWLFEFHWRRRPLRRLGRTWVEALHPRRFWGAWALLQALLMWVGLDFVAVMLNPWVWADKLWDSPIVYLAVLHEQLPGTGLALLMTAWLGYWTACGCRFYLRLKRPVLVATVLSFIVLLAVLCAQLWVAALTA